MVHLIVELIVALFKMLFGDKEPPAHVGPRERRSSYDARRPSRPAHASGQPKTLAELLEEARREAGGGMTTSSSGPKPVYTNPYRKNEEEDWEDDYHDDDAYEYGEPAYQPQPTYQKPVAPPPPPPPPAVAKPKPAKIAQPKPQPATIALSTQAPDAKEYQDFTEFHDFRAEIDNNRFDSQTDDANPFDSLASKKGVEDHGSKVKERLKPWVSALRSSKGEQRILVGAQAFLSHEIFARPRSQRKFRPGGIRPN